MSKVNVNPAIVAYVEREIIPRYDHFDQAHQRDHVMMVIQQSFDIASKLDVDIDMVYAIAAYHDTGLCEGREHHHEVSAQIIKADQQLRQWFTEEQIAIMADAAEDHRASAKQAPRTIYGRIVAEADRFIDPVTIVRRTIQYGLDHYPELSREEQYQRMVTHLKEKYGRNGYLKLWFPDSPNAKRLERLQDLIDDETQLRKLFEETKI
ncbi:MAG: HD domain-containing protein [Bacteroidales bacterium]|nr:HD domain-containing protein [Bacteroidales bacterium]